MLTQEPPKNKEEKKIQEDAQELFKKAKEAIPPLPKFAARLGDQETCPLVNGIIPHVGGPITGPGVMTVLIETQPAAVVEDSATCVGPVAKITSGSTTVHIGGKQAARILDPTDHGGIVTMAAKTVIIGD